MEIVKTAPRITQKTADELAKAFGNVNAGCEYVLDSWPGLYRNTLHDLKGKFLRGELMLMIDVMNGTYLTALIAGQQLDINIIDGIKLDGLDAKWEIDGPALNAKIAALTIFETACLEWWVQTFWQQKEHGNIEEYVAPLVSSEKKEGRKK